MAHDILYGRTKRDWSCGSIALPAKQQRAIFEKVDDVRYDVRRAGNNASLGLLALTGAVGLLAVSNFVKRK